MSRPVPPRSTRPIAVGYETPLDGVLERGDDLKRFRALRFEPPRSSWKHHTLTIPPTLVIESVSVGHEGHDRETKRRWYAELGVPHYWIVDGLARTLDCLRLDGGSYRDDGHGRDDQVVRPASLPGLVIALAEVWDDDDEADDRPAPPETAPEGSA